ncbi:MAG: hypothetical protein KAU62_06380 [Candidatus Heimdallarchaeota archaeon]|nr:hypothetical protein [Candidatus Heimdallarchaeota archaeon]MCG3255692.1 hypothetical protein [Candidatus Heimdallarchaeota archaeon]MCK4610766.1 hypothetical protein [Candidatus Heimdallarchaeota archaeon]
MQQENLVEEMNGILSKMDEDLKNLNRELDKILIKYPKFIDDEEKKLKYAMFKFNNGKFNHGK